MLRVVDRGLAMVIGSTVGFVLVSGGDYGGRCDGDSGGGGGSGSVFECLRCPQTRLSQIPDIRVLSHGTIVGPHTSPFIYQPIRVPDSVSFGCPAPRLGLPLLGSAARFFRCSLFSLYFGVWGKLAEVQFPELFTLSYE